MCLSGILHKWSWILPFKGVQWLISSKKQLCMCVCVCVCVCVSCSVVSNSLQLHGLEPTRLLYPWNSPSKNIGVGCQALLQGIFPTRGWTQVSWIAGRFFIVWATREAPKAALLFLKYFYYFRVTILYHCIGLYSFELLSYTQIHWPLQYCCKVGVRSRTWFYPITNSYVNLLSFTDAGRKQQAPGSESKECITYGTTSVMNISIFVLLSFCS